MDPRIPRSFGSALMLFGAFAIGGVIHEAVVEGSIGLLSPVAVGGLLAGVAFVLVGYRLEREFEPSEYVPDEEAEEEAEEEAAFDEDLSPVPNEALEDRESDDVSEGR